MRDALPNASFVGFTGTPIELQDANTRAVFGDYISIYDIRRSVEDGATVPIYYEGRLAKLSLDEDERPKHRPGLRGGHRGRGGGTSGKSSRTKWAQLEAVVGAEKRVKQIAADIVDHFEQRLEVLHGKAMVVCMSRRICIDLYRELLHLRPDWHDDDDSKGVHEGGDDRFGIGSPGVAAAHQKQSATGGVGPAVQRSQVTRFRIVLVRDMWLTGFDAPSLHTMYVDKPMSGHGLMQAIARVNRVFKDKPGGLVVDYLGLAQDMKQALATYTEKRRDWTVPRLDQEEAVAVMLEKHEVCSALFHGFDWSKWTTGTPQERLEPVASRSRTCFSPWRTVKSAVSTPFESCLKHSP